MIELFLESENIPGGGVGSDLRFLLSGHILFSCNNLHSPWKLRPPLHSVEKAKIEGVAPV